MQASSLLKKCLMAGEPERPCFATRGMKEAIWQVTPARAKQLAPRPDGPLTHFASPRGEKGRLKEDPGQFIAHGPGTPQVLQRPSEGASDAPALDPFIVWAAKVEWTFVTVALPHSVQLGSSTRRLNTSHSNRVSQSEQWYSKIGIAP